ncbi:MAG: hypothetical protein ACR2PK_15505 [Acidimicrobiales bacterium]
MPAQIGGAIADIESVQARLVEAGAASQNHVGEVSADVARLQGEIDDVTRTLQHLFDERAATLLAEIARATRSLESADWDGASREAAAAAEAQLTADLNRTVESGRAGVEALGNAMRQQVSSFHTDVSNDFGAVMTRITESYSELARGAEMFARNLAEADRTISFG